MNSTRDSMVLTLKIIAIFVILISSTHLVLIPLLAPGMRSGCILIAGAAAAALFGASIGYRAVDDMLLVKLGLSACYAAITTLLVLLLSVFIMRHGVTV